MNDHDDSSWIGLHIIEEPLKSGAVGDLFSMGASLVILIKDRLW
nr:hypothetical protein [Ktedonobacter racemifer]